MKLNAIQGITSTANFRFYTVNCTTLHIITVNYIGVLLGINNISVAMSVYFDAH